MSYKTILVHVDRSKHLYRRTEIAARMADLCNAKLVGLALTDMPSIIFDPLVFNPADPNIEPLLQVPRQRAAEALSTFEDIARQFFKGTIETRLEENEDLRGITLQARYCDLVVLGQHDPYETDIPTGSDFAESVIMECGVPVLMVPYAIPSDENIVERMLISWNASREATRAVHYALPVLQRASQVDVAVFDPDTLPSDYRAVPDRDILEWLDQHGIAARVTRQTTAGDIDIGKALLSLSTDLASDMLVMGCYGHARFREVLLGGVSREILRSMTLPVLMAH